MSESVEKFFESDLYVSEMLKVWEEGKEWAEWLDSLAKKTSSGRDVLDVPCGIGRISHSLSELGYNVVGVDISERLLEVAKARSPKVTFLKGDMRRLKDVIGDRKFDLVINIFNSLGYYSEEEDIEILKNLRDSSRKLVVINIDNRDFIIYNLPSVRHIYIPPYLVVDANEFDVSTSRLRVIRTYYLNGKEVDKFEFSQRLYSLHEIVRELKRLGLTVLNVYSGHSWKQFDVMDPQMTIVAKV
ncbi:MAG: class I SAM-dependent methyltransferase [Sulfolobales archaeon]|nr:class I SAM-dependent methyltransferase [Sulfolobales archaeon]